MARGPLVAALQGADNGLESSGLGATIGRAGFQAHDGYIYETLTGRGGFSWRFAASRGPRMRSPSCTPTAEATPPSGPGRGGFSKKGRAHRASTSALRTSKGRDGRRTDGPRRGSGRPCLAGASLLHLADVPESRPQCLYQLLTIAWPRFIRAPVPTRGFLRAPWPARRRLGRPTRSASAGSVLTHLAILGIIALRADAHRCHGARDADVRAAQCHVDCEAGPGRRRWRRRQQDAGAAQKSRDCSSQAQVLRASQARVPKPIPQMSIPAVTSVVELPGAMTQITAPDRRTGPGTGGGGGTGTGSGVGSGNGSGDGSWHRRGFRRGHLSRGQRRLSPVVIREVKPNYTGEAMRARIQGMVTMEAVVMPDGSVGNVHIIKSLDNVFGLDQEAIATVKKWRFKPGMLLGKPGAGADRHRDVVHASLSHNPRQKKAGWKYAPSRLRPSRGDCVLQPPCYSAISTFRPCRRRHRRRRASALPSCPRGSPRRSLRSSGGARRWTRRSGAPSARPWSGR